MKTIGVATKEQSEYYITLDMAKELSMVENNPKGQLARRYFIAIEKEYNKPKNNEEKILEGYKLLLESVENLKLENTNQRKQIAELEPKADFYDTVTQTEDWSSMREVAQTLGIGIGEIQLFQLLTGKVLQKIYGKNNKSEGYLIYEPYQKDGLFKLVEETWTNPKNQKIHIYKKVVVSQKGIAFIKRFLISNGYPIPSKEILVQKINQN
jgi:anti-repressor protein